MAEEGKSVKGLSLDVSLEMSEKTVETIIGSIKASTAAKNIFSSLLSNFGITIQDNRKADEEEDIVSMARSSFRGGQRLEEDQ